jgi:hypothetical protein
MLSMTHVIMAGFIFVLVLLAAALIKYLARR